MNFIAIMIALGVEIFYKPITQWRNYQWFTRYEEWARSKLSGFSFYDSPLTLVIIQGIVFLATAILATALYDLFALLGFVFATFILVYCLGPRDLDDDIEAYLHAVSQDDSEGASHHAEKITGQAVQGDPTEVMQSVREAIFIQGNTRMLGVLFWFVVLGPAGALLFRLSERHLKQYVEQDTGYTLSVQRLFYILAWLPARLSIVGYAVVGNFTDTMSKWSGLNAFWEQDTNTLMIMSGSGALHHHKHDDADEQVGVSEIMEVQALVKRTLIFWLVVLGILTLTGAFF